MEDGKIPGSLVDGKKYAVPVNGFWEAMFFNTEILEAAGVAIPGENYGYDFSCFNKAVCICAVEVEKDIWFGAGFKIGSDPHFKGFT